MNEHYLEINFQKTKLIAFHPYQKSPLNLQFSFNNHIIETVNEFRLLGISIDKNINWKLHIKNIKSKLSKFIYAFREVKKTTNLQTALVVYYAYAYAWLSYGIIMWGYIKIYNVLPETIKNEKKLHLFINKLKKLLLKKAYYSVDEYLCDKSLKLEK
ncbi:hypothetical protein SFRURICE_007911 [Spodoptera frugiperda]|nr:hypothetical protein SFRURICE_007911 [Spodoptera frugiperda]